MRSRYEIMLESYCKIVNIEALTMIEMSRREIIPAVSKYLSLLADTAANKKAISPTISVYTETSLLTKLSVLQGTAYNKTAEIEAALSGAKKHTSNLEKANAYKNEILTLMNDLRAACDEMEKFTSKDCWPMPSYGDLLFGVQ